MSKTPYNNGGRLNVKAPGSPAPRPNRNQDSGRNNNASTGQARGGKAGGMANAAQRAVSAEIRAGVDSLRQDRRIARRQAKRDRSQANADYKRSLGDLNYIYGETGDYINNMNSQINQSYTDQANAAQTSQAAFVQQLAQNSQNAGTGLSNELSRLGLQGVDNSQFGADAQNAQNMAGQMGINNQANIALQQQGANSIGALLGGMVQGSHQSGVGAAVNAKNDTMFQIFQNKRDAYDKVAEAISDLKGTRGDLTKEMIQQLAQSGWGKYLTGKTKHGHRNSSGSSSSGNYSGSSSYGSSGSSSGASGSGHTSGTKPSGGNALAELLYGALNGPR